MRVSSIKTRIKTIINVIKVTVKATLRVSSIKTRIKTILLRTSHCMIHKLWEYLPLKQGLRHYTIHIRAWCQFLWEYLPLKQGLRLHSKRHCRSCHHPLRVSSIKTRIKTFKGFFHSKFLKLGTLRVSSIKTRIKTATTISNSRFITSLWEYLPLKQG